MDFESHTDAVISADISKSLPLRDQSVEFVYTSHVVEHFGPKDGENFLTECYRVLCPGGTIRIITPDLENLARTYLAHLDAKRFELAQIEQMLLLDQLVRRQEGGLLREFCGRGKESARWSDIADYLYLRSGEHPVLGKHYYLDQSLGARVKNPKKSIATRISLLVRKARFLQFVLAKSLMPNIYKYYNLMTTKPGERHLWLYDFYSLSAVLTKVGFCDIAKMSESETSFSDQKILKLDLDVNGNPRTGQLSMFVEAKKLL